METTPGVKGYIHSETGIARFETSAVSDDPSERYEISDVCDGIEFDLSDFKGYSGFVPTACELYELMGKRQLKWAREGAVFEIKFRYAVDNHETYHGSDEENSLTDHTYRVENLVGKPKRYKGEPQ